MMKTNNKYPLLFGLWCMLLAPTLWGQIHYGAITYEIIINLNKRFPSINQQNTHGFGNTRGQNRASNTQYLVENATLYFNDSVSIFITILQKVCVILTAHFLLPHKSTSTIKCFNPTSIYLVKSLPFTTAYLNVFGNLQAGNA